MVLPQAALQTDQPQKQKSGSNFPLKNTEPLIRLRESASHKKAVIFIHGIGAKDPEKYWQQFTDVLLQDSDAFIKDFDVYVWGYPTHKWPKRLKNLFTERSPAIARLGGLWRTTYQEQFSKYEDTVLVCHSMGGLVVKSFIVDVLAEGRSSELEKLKHIAFYATPHSGAPIARVAWNDQLKGMTITAEFIGRIRRSWHDHVVQWKDRQIGPGDYSYNRYIPHLVLWGNEDAVVPDNFAEISGMPFEPVPGDHSTIIQPGNTDDTRYRIWRNALEKKFVSSIGERTTPQDPEPPVNPPDLVNIADRTRKRDITEPPQDAPFRDWAHYYIKAAKKETNAARKALIASGFIRRIEYTNKFDSLEKIKKSFEEFQQRIGNASQLPPEVTLPREQLRVKINRAIEQIRAIQSCIKDGASPCNDIKGKFDSLLQTLSELGRDCKLQDQ